MYPGDLKYTKTHEWVKVEGTNAKVGITGYAQEQLGDIVYVELPEIGRELSQGEAFGVVESVKAVSDCYSPVGGVVVAINQELEASPELVNQDPYGKGWLIAIQVSGGEDLEGLLDASAYEAHVREAEVSH